MTITAEEFRTAAKAAASIGYTGPAAELLGKAEELEQALSEDAIRDEIFEYFESLYFAKDLTLKESINGVLDMLKTDAGLQLVSPIEEAPDYDRKYETHGELNKAKVYTDADGDRVAYYPDQSEWRWRDSSGGGGFSYDSHGPFKLARP